MNKYKNGHAKHGAKKYKEIRRKSGIKSMPIAKNLVDSATEKEVKSARLKRQEAKARHRANKDNVEKISLENSNKRYDVLAQYHQLNYPIIQNIVEEHKLKCAAINNNRLWIIDVSKEEYENIQKWLAQAHFITNQGKPYRVRIAGYKHVEKSTKEKSHPNKKPTHNTTEKKAAAKKARKDAKVAAFKARKKNRSRRKHTTNDCGCGPHLSSMERKLRKEVLKAVKFLNKKATKQNVTKPKKVKAPKERQLKMAI